MKNPRTPTLRGADILLLSPFEEDLCRLRQVLGVRPWHSDSTTTCQEAQSILRQRRFSILISECQLADGSWKDVLASISGIVDPPLLIVTSQFADEALWAEVLNLGGHDVLLKPYEPDEVLRVVGQALDR